MPIEDEKKATRNIDEEGKETQIKRIISINESELSFLTALIREAIGRDEIEIDQDQARFIITHGSNKFEYNGQNNDEYFKNLEIAAEKLGRTTKPEEK